MIKIIKTFVLTLVLAFVGYAIAEDDDPEDMVRCKHCGQSTDECQKRQNCYRYTGDWQDSFAYFQKLGLPDSYHSNSHQRPSIEVLPARLFEFTTHVEALAGEMVVNLQHYPDVIRTGRLKQSDHIIDFLVTLTDASPIPEHPPPLSASIPTTVEIEPPALIPEPPEQGQEMELEPIGGDSNPILIHFAYNMLILEHGVPSQ